MQYYMYKRHKNKAVPVYCHTLQFYDYSLNYDISVCYASVLFFVATTKTQENILPVQKHAHSLFMKLSNTGISFCQTLVSALDLKQASLIHFSPIFPLL